LTPHPTGRWCKKVRGKLVYFGKTDDDVDGQAALARWLDQRDDLLAGRVPRLAADGQATVEQVANRFLHFKRGLVESGELSDATWRDYKDVAAKLVEVFGRNRAVADLRHDDFERLRAIIAKGARGKGVGPVTLGNFITRARVLFRYASESQLIDKPVAFGQGFRRPSRTVMRKLRNERGPKMFAAEELRRMIETASQPLRTMFLLAINAALGNADLGRLPIGCIDMAGAWLDYPRGKTGVRRRAKLWAETLTSVKDWLAERPKANDPAHDGLLFITVRGASWFKGGADDPIAKEVRKLLDKLGIKRKGTGCYAIRHSFCSAGMKSGDRDAVRMVMGHVEDPSDMTAVYNESPVDDARLIALSEFIRRWLFDVKD
jgi:integrase